MTVQNDGMITPAGTLDQAVEQFNLYQQMKTRIGQPDDFQAIGGKKHPKKSFVRKVQRFFNVSCEIVQDEPLKDEKGEIVAWLAKAKAIHQKTGVYQEGDGSCGYDEKHGKQKTLHNIRAHAITRAKNRAILDLVGFGDVSAEEIAENQHQQPAPQQQPKQKPQPTLKERIDKGKQMIVIEAETNKKLTKDERKSIMKTETGKDSLTELTIDELTTMYRHFKSHTAEELKETAKAQMTQTDVIDAEFSEVTEQKADTATPITDEELEDIFASAQGGEIG
ncbi:hypothetical protein IC620_15615 [Hazenella sp. IB182357]|uniref:Uncharacterized protein n=1 Tax=Polycladospora coralii TaxID=2771432 RepID=A0A926NIA8_9BACL|nr:hypothetical protein [Polycladospora coralii]MBD1373773.1 hypothetical protein [Polycladospora coralii]